MVHLAEEWLISIERYWASRSGADRKKRREHQQQWSRQFYEPVVWVSLLLRVVGGGQSIVDHVTE
jgi:hypothetical protein